MLQIILALTAIGLTIFLWQSFPAFKWVITVIIGVPLTILIIIFIWDKGQNLIKERNEIESKKPKIIIGFQDVMLDEKFSDLDFRKVLLKISDEPTIGISVFSVNKNKQELSTSFVDIDDTSKTVKRIFYICPDVKYSYDKPIHLNTIGCYSTGEDILSQYGKENVEILCFSEPTKKNEDTVEIRYYDIPTHNIRYILGKNSVGSIHVAKSEYLKKVDQNKWRKCSSK